MAKKKSTPQQLDGAGEFLGENPEQEAIAKIAAARAEAEKAKDDNGGPILDEAAWRRAAVELVAEQIEIDHLMEKVAEVRGRISSIKKVAEKCGVDWDVIKLYAKYQKRIRIGETGEVVTEQRRLASLMRIMDCPLYTQFGLFPEEPKEETATARPAMEAELEGQAAWRNKEPEANNPWQPGTENHVMWQQGWRNAESAATAAIGRGNGAAVR